MKVTRSLTRWKQSLAGFYKMIDSMAVSKGELAAKTLEDLLSSMIMRPKEVIINWGRAFSDQNLDGYSTGRNMSGEESKVEKGRKQESI